jgi:biotin-(acetyl-CoA carboxylase) ligase
MAALGLRRDVLIADRQTAGRGRLGAALSPAPVWGLVSLLLRPDKAEALESLTCEPQLP